jgi:hypothetical protein
MGCTRLLPDLCDEISFPRADRSGQTLDQLCELESLVLIPSKKFFAVTTPHVVDRVNLSLGVGRGKSLLSSIDFSLRPTLD